MAAAVLPLPASPSGPAPRTAHAGRVARTLLAAGITTLALTGCANLDPYAWSRGSETSSGPGGDLGTGTGSQGGDSTTPAPATQGGRSMPGPSSSPAPAGTIPASVQPPASARERMRAMAIGDFTYECRRHLLEPTRFVWSFVVPNATLYDAGKRPVGRYYAGPTWEGNDRSKVTGRQVGSARAAGSDLPLQLIKAEASTGSGIMKGVSYIQRLNVTGGLPVGPCGASEAGKRQQVKFQAEYVFY